MKAIYPDRTFRLDAEEGLWGEWDRPRMTQVLSNLLGNAVQHGTSSSPISVAARKKEKGIELQVHNEGAAIPSEMITKLFDRFIQGKAGKIVEVDHSTLNHPLIFPIVKSVPYRSMGNRLLPP
jgi:signal transduction histidine kinase